MLEISTPSPQSKAWRRDVLCIALAVILLFGLLGLRPLANPDEGRYTEIPREMAATGDFVTPRLDGVKYFEKPPLLYWLSAGNFQVFGVGDFSARFWCAVFGAAGTLLTYLAGRALFERRTGLLSALVLTTSLLYYGLSRLVSPDILVSVLITAALYAFIVAVKLPAGGRRRWLFWGFYGAMALAVLAKGLIGLVLPCAVIFVWLNALQRWKALRPFYPFSGATLLLAIAAPWHVMVARANSDFVGFYFIHEHFQRFTTQVHDRSEAWWFFGPVLLLGLFPWPVFGYQALRHHLRGSWQQQQAKDSTWFLLIWIVVIVGFFSLSQSKLIPYVLPVIPAAAMLLGSYLSTQWEREESKGFRHGLFAFAGVFGLLASAVCLLPAGEVAETVAALGFWRWILVAWLALGGGATAWLTLRRGHQTGFVAMLLATAGFLLLVNPVAARIDQRSTKPLALLLKTQIAPGDEVFHYRHYFQDFPVYLGQTVGVVDFEGELTFGIHAEPAQTAARFLAEPEFLRRWPLPGRRFAVVRRDDYARLLAQPAFTHSILGEYRGHLLIANRAP